MKKGGKGYIVVETLTSFTLLVCFMAAILSLINVVVIQSRVQYALNQTAQAVSMYEYSLHLTGMDSHLKTMAGKARKTEMEIDEFTTNINDVLDGIKDIAGSTSISGAYQSAQGSYQSGQAAYGQAKEWVETTVNDPKEMLSKVLTFAGNKAQQAAFSALAEEITLRYLSNGPLSGEEYLEKMQVINFEIDPNVSTMLDENGSIIICATYEVKYKFGLLPLPFDTIKFNQRVATQAWLGGAGDGFKP